MLVSLNVKNIAVIKDIHIDFGKGLNIITGETGAGKSIVIDSINFVLGDRADKSLIRFGQDTANVEAVFFIENSHNNLKSLFSENGIDWNEGTIIIKRSINFNGRSDIRVNGVAITVSLLKSIVSNLIDIHSQHETQSLLNENNHMKILDAFSLDNTRIRSDFIKKLTLYKNLHKERDAYPEINDINNQIDILNFQINEIEEANVTDFEEESLIKERTLLQNRERIVSSLANAISLIEGNDFLGVETLFYNLTKEISFLNRMDENYNSIEDRLESLLIETRDIKTTLQEALKNNIYDEEKLQLLEIRIDLIRKIKRKYGNNKESINNFLNKALERRDFLLNADRTIVDINNQISILENDLKSIGNIMHESRLTTGKEFSESIVRQLNDLGMKNASFAVSIELLEDFLYNNYLDLSISGPDKVQFLISINNGEPLKELKKVASGGEMSRIMLAIKNITANFEEIDTLIFDEIDSGISGNAAKTVAQKLYNISVGRQVIVVTHLSQIAAMADNNFLISKHTDESETITKISKLNEEGVLSELMRIAGSKNSSNVGYLAAKELREWGTNYKCSI